MGFIGLTDANWVVPTEIQRTGLCAALAGRDVLGAAKTGSGKTLAYVIPVRSCFVSIVIYLILILLVVGVVDAGEAVQVEVDKPGRTWRTGDFSYS